MLAQRPPRTRSNDVLPVPVLPVMSRLCPSEIFRLRSLIKGLLEEGAQMETRSRRKAVSVGSVTGHSGALRSEDEGREVVSVPLGGRVFSSGASPLDRGVMG